MQAALGAWRLLGPECVPICLFPIIARSVGIDSRVRVLNDIGVVSLQLMAGKMRLFSFSGLLYCLLVSLIDLHVNSVSIAGHGPCGADKRRR